MTDCKFIEVLLRVILFTLITSFAIAAFPSMYLGSFAVADATSQNAATWPTFTGKGEEFYAPMPGEPSAYFGQITDVAGSRSERIYSSYSKGSVYLVVSYNGGSINDTVNSFKVHHFKELTFERDITLDSYKGKQYRVKLSEVTGTVQVYVTKKHAYAVAIIQANNDPPLIQYFLSSFSLTRKIDAPKNDVAKDLSDSKSVPVKQASDLRQAVLDPNSQAVFTGKDVTRRAVVISRPEPPFTEEARQSGLSGTVVLRAVLSSSGKVTEIRVVRGLPKGLTEIAIATARFLKFIPAVKDGRFVSQYVQLEYNFGLY